MVFGAKKVFTDMDTFKIIHKLIDKLSNPNFSQVTVSFVTNKPHPKYVRECIYNQVPLLAYQQLKSAFKIAKRVQKNLFWILCCFGEKRPKVRFSCLYFS